MRDSPQQVVRQLAAHSFRVPHLSAADQVRHADVAIGPCAQELSDDTDAGLQQQATVAGGQHSIRTSAARQRSETAGELADMDWPWHRLAAELCGTALWMGGLVVLPWLVAVCLSVLN